jgi:glycosyltransferase involved in cell wall biosynthesis
MAVGVPIVTGDVGDRRALLNDGAGVVTRPGDATALAQTIRALLEDPARLQAAAESAQTAALRYDWREIARRWLKVYAAPALNSNEALKR